MAAPRHTGCFPARWGPQAQPALPAGHAMSSLAACSRSRSARRARVGSSTLVTDGRSWDVRCLDHGGVPTVLDGVPLCIARDY